MDLDDLIDEILVDAYGDGEQLTAFELAFSEQARLPFPAEIVGTTVEVVKIEFEGDERRGLTAVCRRDGRLHRVSLTPGPLGAETSRLVAAYRRWLGLPDLKPPRNGAPTRSRLWVYKSVASQHSDLAVPLALRHMGTWDPAEQYWGEEQDEHDPLVEELIAAGPRPEFEMEQVIPGVEEDDWDTDPVAEAAELHRLGRDADAKRILKALIAQDERCIDAWVHLGNIAFDTKGPKAAFPLYDRGVSMAEQSLPKGFNGVLPRGLIDNRPFHRALHGLGLCAWRQRRWDDAEAIFTNLWWFEGGDTWTPLSCLYAVRERRRWTSED